jgi:hypothetical protein
MGGDRWPCFVEHSRGVAHHSNYSKLGFARAEIQTQACGVPTCAFVTFDGIRDHLEDLGRQPRERNRGAAGRSAPLTCHRHIAAVRGVIAATAEDFQMFRADVEASQARNHSTTRQTNVFPNESAIGEDGE